MRSLDSFISFGEVGVFGRMRGICCIAQALRQGQSPCVGPHVPPDPATYGTLHLSLDEELEDVNLLQQLASAVGLVIG